MTPRLPRLFHCLTGQGSPTVIMDAGLGETSGTWAAVEPAVAHFTRVVVYDRANRAKASLLCRHAPVAGWCRSFAISW